jgi:hypothetical protein
LIKSPPLSCCREMTHFHVFVPIILFSLISSFSLGT